MTVVLLMLVGVLAGIAPASSQEQPSPINVVGEVRFSGGEPAPGATVNLTHTTEATSYETTTNGRGKFIFQNVEPGDYYGEISHPETYPSEFVVWDLTESRNIHARGIARLATDLVLTQPILVDIDAIPTDVEIGVWLFSGSEQTFMNGSIGFSGPAHVAFIPERVTPDLWSSTTAFINETTSATINASLHDTYQGKYLNQTGRIEVVDLEISPPTLRAGEVNSVHFRLLDDVGEPLAGREIRVLDKTGITGADGNLTLTLLPRPWWTGGGNILDARVEVDGFHLQSVPLVYDLHLNTAPPVPKAGKAVELHPVLKQS